MQIITITCGIFLLWWSYMTFYLVSRIYSAKLHSPTKKRRVYWHLKEKRKKFKRWSLVSFTRTQKYLYIFNQLVFKCGNFSAFKGRNMTCKDMRIFQIYTMRHCLKKAQSVFGCKIKLIKYCFPAYVLCQNTNSRALRKFLTLISKSFILFQKYLRQ
jgi:hypothetical protein